MQAAAETAVNAGFSALGLIPRRWHTVAALCAGGGRIWTVAATASGVPNDLRVTAGGRPDVTIVLDEPTVLAYREHGTGTAVSASAGETTVTATTLCQR